MIAEICFCKNYKTSCATNSQSNQVKVNFHLQKFEQIAKKPLLVTFSLTN